MFVDSAPVISVIMPVFNGTKTLERALDSLRVQSFPQWELLAVDDGSADDSFDLLTRAAAGEPRIRPFRLDRNRGPAAARNHGLVQARGEWITYLDCDDEYDAEYLQEVAAWGGNAEVLVFGYDLLQSRRRAARRLCCGPGSRRNSTRGCSSATWPRPWASRTAAVFWNASAYSRSRCRALRKIGTCGSGSRPPGPPSCSCPEKVAATTSVPAADPTHHPRSRNH